jgi:uncharacterized FlaG/YvyC family protein
MSKEKNEKKALRLKAIAKGLKEKKGLVVKESELKTDISKLEKAQKEIKETSSKFQTQEGKTEADRAYKKLQNIIDDLNEYMAILHPEGLIQLDTSSLANDGSRTISSG